MQWTCITLFKLPLQRINWPTVKMSLYNIFMLTNAKYVTVLCKYINNQLELVYTGDP